MCIIKVSGLMKIEDDSLHDQIMSALTKDQNPGQTLTVLKKSLFLLRIISNDSLLKILKARSVLHMNFFFLLNRMKF